MSKTQIGSSRDLFTGLQAQITSRLSVICFYSPGEISENLQEFYNEIIQSFDIAVFLLSSEDSTQEAFNYYNVLKVPTNLFIIGFKVVQVIEGASIPDLFSAIESYSNSFSRIFEETRNTEYRKISDFIGSSHLTVYLKGSISQPKSRRSQKLVRMLNGYDYQTFDISSDKCLAEYVKLFTGSAVFPKFFLHGNYCGSIEELAEAIKAGSLSKSLEQDLNTRLHKLINSQKHLVVMMGSKEEPICGFSKRLISLLAEYGLQYDTFDISIDNEVCEGLKVLSNWPTYPQVYANGELIGGLDICMQLHTEGSLKEALGI